MDTDIPDFSSIIFNNKVYFNCDSAEVLFVDFRLSLSGLAAIELPAFQAPGLKIISCSANPISQRLQCFLLNIHQQGFYFRNPIAQFLSFFIGQLLQF